MCAGTPRHDQMAASPVAAVPMATVRQIWEHWGRAVSKNTIKRAIDAGQFGAVVTIGQTRMVAWSAVDALRSPAPSGGTS